MSTYEITLIGGSLLCLLGVLGIFTAIAGESSKVGSVLVLAMGGGVLAYAHNVSPEGIDPRDIPDTIVAMVAWLLN